jgi:hypothetical protein
MNDPSREPPAAVKANPCLAGSRCARTAFRPKVAFGDANTRSSVGLSILPSSHGPIALLASAALEMEASVASPVAVAGKANLRRRQDEIGEMQDAVRRALQIGGDARQATGEAAEEGVVEPHHLRGPLPDHARTVPARTGDDAQRGFHVDDAEPRDQVAAKRAVNADLKLPGLEIQLKVDAPAQLVRPQHEVVPRYNLCRDAQPPVDRQVSENTAGDIAHTGYARGGEADAKAPSRIARSSIALPVMLPNRAGGRSSLALIRTLR